MSLGSSSTPFEADLNSKSPSSDAGITFNLVDPDFNKDFASATGNAGDNGIKLASMSAGFGGFDIRNIFENLENVEKDTEKPKEVDLEKFENKTYDAYAEALGKVDQANAPFGERYMVLMLTRDNCGFCQHGKQMLKEVGGSIGDKAVFSVSDPTKSPGARDIASAIGEERVPAFIVLASNRDTLYVTGKFVGQPENSKELKTFLAKSTEKPMSSYGRDNESSNVAFA